MRVMTARVRDYLEQSRRSFAATILPSPVPVAEAIAAAEKAEDLLGLEAIAKVCAEAAEMAESRNQLLIAEQFTLHREAALLARSKLV